jgi:hypothetical protein
MPDNEFKWYVVVIKKGRKVWDITLMASDSSKAETRAKFSMWSALKCSLDKVVVVSSREATAAEVAEVAATKL